MCIHTLILLAAPVAGQDQASEVGPEAARHGAVEFRRKIWGDHGTRGRHCDLTGMMVNLDNLPRF